MTSSALKTDLYELTMAAGYFTHQVKDRATFELYCHTLPENRNYLIACGLRQAMEYILNLRFTGEDIAYLRGLEVFKHVDPAFFDYLENFRFSGNVWAMEEGEVFFANEPLLQVSAPVIEAQVLETYLLSIFNIATLVASKAARVVQAANSDGRERMVVDFGARRAHGPDAAELAARAAYLAGCFGTSNVSAGKKYGIPVFGTMAHSWVEVFGSEKEAFEKFQKIFPDHTTLLIDTYDTLNGARTAAGLGAPIKAVRVDSGDLDQMSRAVRVILDDQGLQDVKIIASGNLNEHKIAALVSAGAPVDSFGVGTDMVVSRDAPALDLTYKLVQTENERGQILLKAKKSPDKQTIPGRKQVFRYFDQKGVPRKDVIAFAGESPDGAAALLTPVIRQGSPCAPQPAIEEIRAKIRDGLRSLPAPLRAMNASAVYPVELSAKIARAHKMLGQSLDDLSYQAALKDRSAEVPEG